MSLITIEYLDLSTNDHDAYKQADNLLDSIIGNFEMSKEMEMDEAKVRVMMMTKISCNDLQR